MYVPIHTGPVHSISVLPGPRQPLNIVLFLHFGEFGKRYQVSPDGTEQLVWEWEAVAKGIVFVCNKPDSLVFKVGLTREGGSACTAQSAVPVELEVCLQYGVHRVIAFGRSYRSVFKHCTATTASDVWKLVVDFQPFGFQTQVAQVAIVREHSVDDRARWSSSKGAINIQLQRRLQRAKTRQDTSTTILKSFSLYIVHCSYVSSTSYSLSSPSSPSTDAKFVNSPSSDAFKLRFVPWGRAAIFVPRVRSLVVSA